MQTDQLVVCSDTAVSVVQKARTTTYSDYNGAEGPLRGLRDGMLLLSSDLRPVLLSVEEY